MRVLDLDMDYFMSSVATFINESGIILSLLTCPVGSVFKPSPMGRRCPKGGLLAPWFSSVRGKSCVLSAVW